MLVIRGGNAKENYTYVQQIMLHLTKWGFQPWNIFCMNFELNLQERLNNEKEKWERLWQLDPVVIYDRTRVKRGLVQEIPNITV